MEFEDERRQLAALGRRMGADGLCVGTAGNLSVRCGEVIVITPSGIPYEETEPEHMCVVSVSGEVVDAPAPPSSEVPMHLAVYRASSAGAVVHTHAPVATALSTVVTELPAIHYVIAGLGGTVRVSPYETFGTEELAANMSAALSDRTGVILQNHGTITYGRTLRQAYDRAVTLEWLSATYWRAKVFGEPNILPDEEIERVRQRARTRGWQPAHPPEGR